MCWPAEVWRDRETERDTKRERERERVRGYCCLTGRPEFGEIERERERENTERI
jgi:hypothetical protein